MDYFKSKERQDKLVKILNEWVDTPFRHRCGVKGLGCDCIHLIVRVFEEFELITWHKDMIPVYPKDWHVHNTRELLAEAIERYLNVEKVDLTKLKNGDLILSHYGRAASHIGIYFDGYVYQALTKIGVKKINFSDKTFRKQMRFAYRVIE